MVNYVNTVLVSNLVSGAVLTAEPKDYNGGTSYNVNQPSADAGKFIIMNCDPNVEANKLYNVTADNALDIDTIKVGIVTKKNCVLRKADGSAEYRPIIKWSNEIKAADIKSFNVLSYESDTEDTVTIDFSSLDEAKLTGADNGGKRIIIRLTYKDMPHRYRKWTESYEYVVSEGDTKTTIATGIADLINREWKRARVSADKSTANKVILTALPYDDDDSVDSLNWANKVRFNVNIYWTDPSADGWESKNKYFPKGVTVQKTPGKTYEASAKLVRDRESWAMGYLGILNRGEGTWPIIKPAMETDLSNHYDAITLEFENMYRAADDIQRKTKQTLEVYATHGQLGGLQAILASFVAGETALDKSQSTAIAGKQASLTEDQMAAVNSGITAQNLASIVDTTDENSLASRVAALELFAQNNG